MTAVMGRSRPTPAAPSGMRSVSAASGPYAADESASSPSTGTADSGRSRSSSAAESGIGLPKSISRSRIPQRRSVPVRGAVARRRRRDDQGQPAGATVRAPGRHVAVHRLVSDAVTSAFQGGAAPDRAAPAPSRTRARG
jgi:hypothetical protein